MHTHTWYAALAGYLAKVLYDVPLVATVHSLEPLRPWKEEQLGRSYHLSTWVRKLALENADRIIAVSRHARGGHPAPLRRRSGPRPGHPQRDRSGSLQTGRIEATRKAWDIQGDYILFVGRISREKGMEHLIEAMKHVDPGVQCVCCTSAPDTPEIEGRPPRLLAPRVVWINSLLREEQYVELYTHARVFVCPSVYEPFGIINLESMACETPIVASAVGGILETVVDGETGLLVVPARPEP